MGDIADHRASCPLLDMRHGLQRALYYCNGYINVAVDGEFGPITRGTVLDFQQDINRAYGSQILIPDGVYRMELLDWMPFPLWTPGEH